MANANWASFSVDDHRDGTHLYKSRLKGGVAPPGKRRLWVTMAAFQLLKRTYRKAGERHFIKARSNRT